MSVNSQPRPGAVVRRGAMIALAALLCGCAVGPNFRRPSAPPVTHYSSGADPTVTMSVDGTAQRFTPGGKLAADWWHLFNSAQLDAVVREALRRNPGLEAAQASLHQSENNLRSGYGIFFPSIDAEAAATRERFSTLNFGENAAGSVFNLFTLSASVSYALDLFGGQRRMVEGLHAQMDMARATEQAAYLTLSANVVNTVIARAAYRAEIDATRQLIELMRQQVQLAEVEGRRERSPIPTSSACAVSWPPTRPPFHNSSRSSRKLTICSRRWPGTSPPSGRRRTSHWRT